MSKISFGLVFCFTISSFVYAADSRLALVGTPSIVIDPYCNAAGKGAAKVKVRNEGSGAGAVAVPLYLSITDAISKPAGKVTGGALQVAPISDSDQPLVKKTLAPGEELWIKIEASGFNETGEWEVTLQNENVDAGKIRIVRNELPFPVSLDVATPDAPELTFVEGQPSSFRLQNDGASDYLFTWQYNIAGHVLHSTDNAASDAPQAVPAELPRNGLTPVTFSIPPDWFGSRFEGLFKDNIQDGRLVVSRVDPTCKSAVSTKIFKIKTHLARSVGSDREVWADFWVFWILLLGGLCSLTLNFALPNQMKRLKLKEKLGTLGRQISDLSMKLASRLRVVAGLEQRLLADRLKNLTWTNSDFTAEMDSIEQASGQLETRIQLLGRIGSTRFDFEKMRSLNLPPTVILDMEGLFEKMIGIARKSEFLDTDSQNAQTILQTLQSQMDTVGKSNTAWVSGLPDRVKNLKAKFDASNGTIGKSATWKAIKANFGGAEAQLNGTDPAQIAERDYLILDRALFKLERVVDYVCQVEHLQHGDVVLKRIKEHEPQLLNALKYDSWEQLNFARGLVGQMRQGKFADDILQAVSKKAVRVKGDRVLVRQFEQCDFMLEFPSSLDGSSALEEWTCRWDFSLEGEPTLHEEGWQVSHYFQKSDKYTLAVTLINNADRTEHKVDAGEAATVDVQGTKRRKLGTVLGLLFRFRWGKAAEEWNKSRTGAGRVLEILWLVLALFLALIGMIAGAKEQVLKLDLVPALIAIFLVGFAADQIKNLLTRKQ
jgi:hypothetical protein